MFWFSLLFDFSLSAGIAQCDFFIPIGYWCINTCYNTGGICNSIYCTCQNSAVQDGIGGCQCTGTLGCGSYACFTGCTGIASDGTQYYAAPPSRPNQCLQCTSPKICSGWVVTGCSTGVAVYNHQFCCGTNCATCDDNDCLSCQQPSNQFITGLNCSVCNAPNVCSASLITSCTGAYYYQSHACIACGTNCLTCNSTACLSCISSTNYYIQGINCNVCTSPNICSNNAISSCISGYFYSSSTCTQCSINCLQCSQTTCTQCIDTVNYYFDGFNCPDCDNHRVCSMNIITACNPADAYYLSASICIQCLSPNICSNSQISSCVQGYYFSSQSCHQCSLNCEICSSSLCTQCLNGYYENGSSACQQCPGQCSSCDQTTCTACVSPCATCNMSTCLSCVNTNQYVSSSTTCSDCPSHCLTCNSTICLTCVSPCLTCTRSVCQSCISQNYYLQGTTCIQCESSCATCNSFTCLTCPQTNQYIDQHICQNCPTQCLTCDNLSCYSCQWPCATCSRSQCLTCISDQYYPIGITCQACDYSCDKCDMNGCLQCPLYFYISGNQCLDCHPSCQQCTSTECLRCPLKEYISGNQCLTCQSECAACNSNGCLSCENQAQYPQLGQCIDCPVQCSSCDANTCFTCRFNCLTCNHQQCTSCISNQYYLNEIGQCVNCPERCLTCNQTVCLTCLNPYILQNGECIYECDITCQTCNQTTCLSCLNPSQFLSGHQCINCSNHCLTCSNSTCLSCDNFQSRQLVQNQCICIDGYQDIDGICTSIDCNSIQAITIQSCMYQDCNDGVYEYGEQCDDGNSIQKDGCTNCKIDSGYTCLNTLLKSSICLPLPNNCLLGIISQSVICNECMSGYYLSNNYCNQCQSECSQCLDQLTCTYCRFTTSPPCQLCEVMPGYYSNYTSNSCYTICGDSIQAGNEECDNGNTGIGCTQCQLDKGYECFLDTCSLIVYPIPTLQSLNNDQNTLYNNTRVFQVNFNIPVVINMTTDTQVQITGLSDIDYTYQWNQNQLTLILNTSSINNQLILSFEKIQSLEGVTSKILSVDSQISDYLIVSAIQQQAALGLGISLQYMLIVLAVFVGLSIILGGLETFWNLLDLLYPYNLQAFLSLFSFIQLSNLPINQYMNIQSYLDNDSDINNFYQPPFLIAEQNYTCIIIINIFPLMMIWVTAIGIYYIAKLIQAGLQKLRIQNLQTDSSRLVYLKLLIMLIQQKLIKICTIIQFEFYYSGLIRTFQSSAYDMAFVIVLGIFAFDIQNLNPFVIVNSVITVIALIIYFMCVYKIFQVAGYCRLTIKINKLRYGAVFETFKQEQQCVYINSFYLCKKFIFMVILILFYNVPIYQSVTIILISLIQVMYYIATHPFEDQFERVKQVSCEIFVIITELMFLVLVIDDQVHWLTYLSRDIIGWLCICGLITVILTQISVDVIQQLEILKKLYKKFKKFTEGLSGRIKQPIFEI